MSDENKEKGIKGVDAVLDEIARNRPEVYNDIVLAEMANYINRFKKIVLDNNIAHGFWEGLGQYQGYATVENFAPEQFNKSEKLMLMVSELAEACESLRKGNPGDDKLPQYPGDGVELADCIIRILDYCAAYNIPIGEIIKAKHEYNVKRPYKHGKQF